MVNNETLRKISHTTPILDVLDYYGIEYQASGPNRYRALCPFHNDHSPSLVLYIDPKDHLDESFYCFVDHTGGDVFRFIQHMEEDFQKAWSVLCHIRGIKDDDATEIDNLELASQELQKETRQEEVSVSSYNYQISTMYRDFLIRNSNVQNYTELEKEVDKRFQVLDNLLNESPSAVEVRQFFLHELQFLSLLQSRVDNAPV